MIVMFIGTLSGKRVSKMKRGFLITKPENGVNVKGFTKAVYAETAYLPTPYQIRKLHTATSGPLPIRGEGEGFYYSAL